MAMVFKVYAKWTDRADKGAEAAKASAVIGVQLSPHRRSGSIMLRGLAETEGFEPSIPFWGMPL